jgi:hypothetical protein
MNQDSPKYKTGLLIVNVLGVQEGKQGKGRGEYLFNSIQTFPFYKIQII